MDPDGYWIEIVSRHEESTVNNKFTFAQTMIRVKDPVKSLHFYRDVLGMTLIRETHMGVGTDWAFSLYFLAHMSVEEASALPPPDSPEAGDAIRNMFRPVLELTHNHGTENDVSFKYAVSLKGSDSLSLTCMLFYRYHNGNDTAEGQVQGFGHTGFLVDDLAVACNTMMEQGVVFKKKPEDGNMRGKL